MRGGGGGGRGGGRPARGTEWRGGGAAAGDASGPGGRGKRFRRATPGGSGMRRQAIQASDAKRFRQATPCVAGRNSFQRSIHHWITILARNPTKPTPSPRNSTKVPNRPALDSQASWPMMHSMYRMNAPTPQARKKPQ